MYREVTSEQLSVREGAGYDEVFQSGHEPEEGLSLSSKRETTARSFDDEAESHDREVEKGGSDVEVEDHEDEGVASKEGSSGSDEDGHTHPFILPKIWTVNDFMPTMTKKVFKELRDRYQIPGNIPIRFPGKFEKCYLGRTKDIGMYDAMFAVGLRLSLTALHRQFANILGLFVSQIAPNVWRIFIGVEILWGRLSEGNRQLTIHEFF